MRENGVSKRWLGLFSVLLLPVLILISIPINIAESNLDDMLVSLDVINLFIFLALVTSIIFSFVYLKYSNNRLVVILSRIFLFASFFIVLSDATRHIMDSADVNLFLKIIVDFLIVLMLIKSIQSLSDSFLVVISGVVLLSSLLSGIYIYLFKIMPAHNDISSISIVSNNENKNFDLSLGKGNVYHIIFDSFQGGMIEHLDIGNTLSNDFTYFSQFSTNYPRTRWSLGSLMRGRYYNHEDTMPEFWTNAADEGYLGALYENNVSLYLYPLNKWGGYKKATINRDAEEVGKVILSELQAMQLFDFWFLAIIPNSVRDLLNPENLSTGLVFDGSEESMGFSISRLFSRLLGFNDLERIAGRYNEWLQYAGVKQFDELIEIQNKVGNQGNYFFYHAYIPHFPWNVNEKCVITGDSSIEQQYQCTIHMMQYLVDVLKEKGLYDDALIIFQSDHGDMNSFIKEDNYKLVNRSITKKLFPDIDWSDTVLPKLQFDYYLNKDIAWPETLVDIQSSGLLLVKFPGVSGKKTSYSAQQIDIAPTILDHFHIPVGNKYQGVILAPENINIDRESEFFSLTRGDGDPFKMGRFVKIKNEWQYKGQVKLD